MGSWRLQTAFQCILPVTCFATRIERIDGLGLRQLVSRLISTLSSCMRLHVSRMLHLAPLRLGPTCKRCSRLAPFEALWSQSAKAMFQQEALL